MLCCAAISRPIWTLYDPIANGNLPSLQMQAAADSTSHASCASFTRLQKPPKQHTCADACPSAVSYVHAPLQTDAVRVTGLRPYMEDRCVVVASYQPLSGSHTPVTDGVPRSFAAVVDGHNGCQAADHVTDRYHSRQQACGERMLHLPCLVQCSICLYEFELLPDRVSLLYTSVVSSMLPATCTPHHSHCTKNVRFCDCMHPSMHACYQHQLVWHACAAARLGWVMLLQVAQGAGPCAGAAVICW